MKLFRQGDLLIQHVEELPKGLKKVQSGILLLGEATGHAHRISGGKVFADKAGMLFFTVGKKATLTHEEHKPIIFGKGKFAVIRQREYVSSDMTKLVVD